MEWITREYSTVDRVACPWLIWLWIDAPAEFVYVPADRVVEEAERLGVTSSEVKGAEDKELTREPRGLQALLDGVRAMNDPDDQAKRQASVPILNALYAFRRTRVGAERSA